MHLWFCSFAGGIATSVGVICTLLHNCYIYIVIIYTPGLIPSLNGPLACCHVQTYHHVCILLYFHIDIFNFIPYYHIMDVYCIFYFVLPHQNAPLHLFFTIFHALIFSTTFCIIAFRIFMLFYFMLHAFSLWCYMPGSTR